MSLVVIDAGGKALSCFESEEICPVASGREDCIVLTVEPSHNWHVVAIARSSKSNRTELLIVTKMLNVSFLEALLLQN